LYCIFTFFFLHLCYYYLLFKAASLDGMAFLVAVHYVIFLLVLILYASLENKFFFFFFFIVTRVNVLLKINILLGKFRECVCHSE